MSEKSDEQRLSIREVQAILRLPAKMCRTWVRQKVPAEAIKREGRYVYVARWGLHDGLKRCTWQPKPRKGYQYRSGRFPVNVASRDKLGRFVSNRPPGEVRPPKRKGFVHPRRRPYIKQKD